MISKVARAKSSTCPRPWPLANQSTIAVIAKAAPNSASPRSRRPGIAITAIATRPTVSIPMLSLTSSSSPANAPPPIVSNGRAHAGRSGSRATRHQTTAIEIGTASAPVIAHTA